MNIYLWPKWLQTPVLMAIGAVTFIAIAALVLVTFAVHIAVAGMVALGVVWLFA